MVPIFSAQPQEKDVITALSREKNSASLTHFLHFAGCREAFHGLLGHKPLAGKRLVQVPEQRTKKDWALFMQEVLEEHYPDASKVVVVMDNLNTHTPVSFYEVFPPKQAKALADRFPSTRVG